MKMISIILIVSVISVALSTNCQYFQYEDGPAIPCDVCFKVQSYDQYPGEYSYEFSCDSSSSISVSGYKDGKCKSSYGSFGPINGLAVSTSGGTCDHITFRSYAAYSDNQHGYDCVKQDQVGYWEFGFVEGCFNSIYQKPYSADLSCTDTNSFDIKVYDEQNCNGDIVNKNYTTINTGCQESGANITGWINKAFGTDLPLPPLSANQTYFEISECGGAWPLWATILIIVGSVLCCCGICAALAWVFCRRRKGGMNSGYVQTYG